MIAVLHRSLSKRVSFRSQCWQMRTMPRLVGALGMLLLLLISVIIGPLLWRVDPTVPDLSNTFAGISWDAPLGTDEYGRDLLSRILHGGRRSFFGALVVVLGSSGIGLVVGACAGVCGGRIDSMLSRCIDGFLALPSLVIALAMVGVLGKSFGNLLIALVLTNWPWYARVYRGLILSERTQPYVEAAYALGIGQLRIAWRHIGPNILGSIVVLASANIGSAIVSLTALSFLGLGMQPPHPEWGAMVNSARVYFQTEPWVIVVPGVAIAVTVLTVNILGDALRDAITSQGENS